MSIERGNCENIPVTEINVTEIEKKATIADSAGEKGTIADSAGEKGTIADSAVEKATIAGSAGEKGTIADSAGEKGTIGDSAGEKGTIADSAVEKATKADSAGDGPGSKEEQIGSDGGEVANSDSAVMEEPDESVEGSDDAAEEYEDDEYEHLGISELVEQSKVHAAANRVCTAYHLANLAILKGVADKKEGEIPLDLREMFLHMAKVAIALLESKSDLLAGLNDIVTFNTSSPVKESVASEGTMEVTDMDLHPEDKPTEDDVWATLEIARTLYGRVLSGVEGDYGELPVPPLMEFLVIPDATEQNVADAVKSVMENMKDVEEENVDAIQQELLEQLKKSSEADGFYKFMDSFEFVRTGLVLERPDLEADVKSLATCFLLLGDLLLLSDNYVGALTEYQRSFYCLVYYGLRDSSLKSVMVNLAQTLVWSQRPKDAVHVYNATIRLLRKLEENTDDVDEKRNYASLIEDVNVAIEELNQRVMDGEAPTAREHLTSRIQALKTALGNVNADESGTKLGFSRSQFGKDVEVAEIVPRKRPSYDDGLSPGDNKKMRTE